MGGHKTISASSYEKPVYVPAPVWVSPTDHEDPAESWNDPEYTYDNNLATRALTDCYASAWSEYLYLLIQPSISCIKVRFFGGDIGNPHVDTAQVSVYYDDVWHVVYEGLFLKGVWNEYDVPGVPSNVNAARIRFYNSSLEIDELAYLNEFQFLKVL